MNLEKFKKVLSAKIEPEFFYGIDFIDKMIKDLDLEKNSKILDIGTGFGIMAIILALNGFDVLTGEPEEDPERDDWEHHESHQGSLGSNWREFAKAVGVDIKIKYQYFDAQYLPFPDESFNGIFMYDALQHVQNREVALKECIRVLKHDGVIGVIEWTEKQIEKDYKKYGFKLDFIDPKAIIRRDDVSIEKLKGELVNIYLLRKSIS